MKKTLALLCILLSLSSCGIISRVTPNRPKIIVTDNTVETPETVLTLQ